MYELLSIVVNRILIRKRGGDTGRARGRRQQAGSVGSMWVVSLSRIGHVHGAARYNIIFGPILVFFGSVLTLKHYQDPPLIMSYL